MRLQAKLTYMHPTAASIAACLLIELEADLTAIGGALKYETILAGQTHLALAFAFAGLLALALLLAFALRSLLRPRLLTQLVPLLRPLPGGVRSTGHLQGQRCHKIRLLEACICANLGQRIMSGSIRTHASLVGLLAKAALIRQEKRP